MYSDTDDNTHCCHIIKNSRDNSYKLCNNKDTYQLFCYEHSHITSYSNTDIYIINKNFFNKLKSIHNDLHKLKDSIDIKKNIESKIIKKLILFCNEKQEYKNILNIFNCQCNKKNKLFQESSYLKNICINHLFDCCHFINDTFNTNNNTNNNTNSRSSNNVTFITNNFISNNLIYTKNDEHKKEHKQEHKQEHKDNFISSKLINISSTKSINKNDIDNMLKIDDDNFYNSNDKPDSCPICMDDLNNEEDPLHCGHWVHLHCLFNWKEIQKLKNIKCPVCRQDIDLNKKIEKKDRMVRININKNLNDIESVSLFFELTIMLLRAMNNTNKKKLVKQDKNNFINKLSDYLNKLK